ncbi:hypothetical protein DNU06_05060 [Putridiphycobacter roseus]|uniref:Uncharacterized protein n=1 Tax=Putridiphycobacter roseus TaxID=2219161 RepID=A0A2W1N4K5_9FLAO|nr:hypothetical protein [Putridiphycobacter roseus]PZE17991.1 hypothetical protein DNU06_05060 [Putridiphycobacter roseus]
MKKFTLLLYLTGLLTTFSFAQRPEYNDLIVYFADGNLEKLLKQAEKYTTADDSRKDAIPYLYLSKANLEISKGGDLAEEFPRAFKDAVKYAGKAIQKDDDDRTMYNANLPHFTAVKKEVFEQIRNLVESNDYGRLMGVLPLMEKIEKGEIGTAFLKAVAKYQRGDKSGFRIEQKEALALLDNFDTGSLVLSDDDSIEEAAKKKIDREVFKFGIIQYAKTLVVMEETSEAKAILGKVKQLYEEDKNFMKEYNKIVN